MQKLLSISNICQSMPKEFLMHYCSVLTSPNNNKEKLYIINNISERFFEKENLDDQYLLMIEALFQRNNIKKSIACQIINKISNIEKATQ